MRYRKIGIDLDGVLCDFVNRMVNILRHNLHVPLPDDFQPGNWDWVNANLPPNTFKDAWAIIDSEDRFWEELAPIQPNVELMKRFFNLRSDTYDFYFITARKDGLVGNSAKRQSENWLSLYLGSPERALTVLPVNHALEKVPLLKALGIDYFIDDHDSTIHHAVVESPNTKSYLFAQPWNQTGREGINVVKSFNDFLIKVENNL